jgi:hypothetical protein
MKHLEPWIILLTIVDRAGSTAAVASVFSGRGIQLDSFLGFGGEAIASGGRVLISFRAFPERVAVICRVLESLSVVTRLESYRYSDCPAAIRQAAEALKVAMEQQQSGNSKQLS